MIRKAVAISSILVAGFLYAQEELGGELVMWPENAGTFLFVNAQTKIPAQDIADNVKKLAEEFSVDIRMVAGSFPGVTKVTDELVNLNAKGAIWIVDDISLPISLSATEDGWGVLNIAKLVKDGQDVKKILKRLTKYINRSFAYVNGIGDSSMMPACVMKQAVGIAEVDALLCATYSPEACSKIGNYLSMSGYKRCRRGTYYDACEEGWAPAPTNAVQKKIWDKVHQLPSKPLVILPESQRKKK